MTAITEIILSAFVSECSCLCSHCLLGKCQAVCGEGIITDLKRLAERLSKDTSCPIYINPYRSIEYKELPDVLEWNKKVGNGPVHININGTKIRKGEELKQWIRWLEKTCKTEILEISWFGTEKYMDRFVHCRGYYRYLMNLVEELKSSEIQVEHKIFIMNDNLITLKDLYDSLIKIGGSIWPAFVDYRGLAKKKRNVFFDMKNFDSLPDWAKSSYLFTYGRYETEAEWIRKIENNEELEPKKATVMIVLSEENRALADSLTYSDIIKKYYIHLKKKHYYIPDYVKLAKLYGQPDSQILYEFRGLVQKWQTQYIKDCCPEQESLLFSDVRSGFLLR